MDKKKAALRNQMTIRVTDDQAAQIAAKGSVYYIRRLIDEDMKKGKKKS